MHRKIVIIFIFSFTYSFSQTVPQKVFNFAKQNLNKKVDRGECWDLANAALNAAGAQWTSPYDFGTKTNIQSTQPGDIIQFTNTKLKFPYGSMSFPKHTAIVYASTKKQITLIHQNFNNKRTVDTITIQLDYIVKGKAEAYRPK
ncbi:MAG: CHAP domain-containing protein [Sphingobacteriaceae bacterium]|nr:CHAP domain-containing protein [Sphingobacteriaceae bacterium]